MSRWSVGWHAQMRMFWRAAARDPKRFVWTSPASAALAIDSPVQKVTRAWQSGAGESDRARALGGGWVATRLFHIHALHGFFNLSTWLTAIAGSAVLLIAYRVVDGQTGHRMIHR